MKKYLLLMLLFLAALPVASQEERIDTVIPKFLINGYFFREMPKLPDAEQTFSGLKDKEGNRLLAIGLNVDLPKSVIRQAIPREQVHNADQFLNSINMMQTMRELTQAKIKADGTFYSPKAGEPFPQFSEKDMDGRIWTNDSIRGRVMVLNLWYSGCGPCRAEMPELSTWKELFPDVMFFSATYHDAELAKRITDKHHFTWTHLVETKDMMSWIGTEGFPFTVVVDKQGIVRHAVHGTSKEKRAELLSKIKEATIAKDNFKMSGRIDGVGNDTLCIEYVILQPEKQIVKRKVAVIDGKFSFSAELREAYFGSLYLKSNPKETLYTYFVPDEEAVFSGRLNSVEEHWGGSAFYQQYEQVIDVQRPFNKEFAAARNEPDSIRGLKNRDINSRAKPLYLKYIEEHPNEDATVALLIHVNYDQVLTAIGKLTPEVRNGRMKSEIASYEKMFTLVMKEHAAREAVKNDTVTIGGQVPELGLKDLDGNVLELKSLRGKYVVLDFWGSWCTWCIKGFPKLKEYYAKYKDRLEIVGIDCNDTAEKWAAAVKKHSLPWLHVRSEDGIAEQKFRVQGYPYKVLISPEGTVLKAYLGETEEFYQYLDSTLELMLTIQ